MSRSVIDHTDVAVDEIGGGYVRLRVKVTRGTGVRDVDEVVGELVTTDTFGFDAGALAAFREDLTAEVDYWRAYDPDGSRGGD